MKLDKLVEKHPFLMCIVGVIVLVLMFKVVEVLKDFL